ncbi:HAD hydrolase-like protein [Deinococcus xianganensis]|uniref:Phosphoribosyltransferase domain-containing protein n=1 Tax=Deinococcus xianganensis TaxID=1507289 RepID=A0A6I4YUS2_9DEIO|nr:hypothetical protein [Deinococcus xianganensis]MXV20873.1 hypothetical protein [Deinococcus xianganensis]
MIQALFIDSTVINKSNVADINMLIKVLKIFKSQNVCVGIVSTNKVDVERAKTLIPEELIDIAISGEEVYGKGSNLIRKFKGGPDRISIPASKLGIKENRILYIGDDKFDYLSAIHSGAFFLFATWTGRKIDSTFTAQTVQKPEGIWGFSSHFLMHKPRWAYSLDMPHEKSKLRALMNSNTRGTNSILFVCDPPDNTFRLREVLKDHKPIRVANRPAMDVLFWHAIASARLEGLLPPRCLVTVYASSKPGKVNPTINSFMKVGSKAFGTFFYNDMFVRSVEVRPTHELRLARIPVDIDHQTDSVHLNPEYIDKIKGQTIVVFDDFHTSGSSLEWARNLLISAGAEEVILIAIGKFGAEQAFHQIRSPNIGVKITPFMHKSYGKSAFSLRSSLMRFDNSVSSILQRSFGQLLKGLPYW